MCKHWKINWYTIDQTQAKIFCHEQLTEWNKKKLSDIVNLSRLLLNTLQIDGFLLKWTMELQIFSFDTTTYSMISDDFLLELFFFNTTFVCCLHKILRFWDSKLFYPLWLAQLLASLNDHFWKYLYCFIGKKHKVRWSVIYFRINKTM